MNIGIIDADLLDNGTRFPNLALMKCSGYHKEQGHSVSLILDWGDINNYDKVFIGKVFSYTKVPIDLDKLSHVQYGGTGFFYDKAPFFPDEIEHHMPDYNLYNDYVKQQLENNVLKKELEYYLNYSVGFTTRGCFRKCEFCVNKRYDKAEKHSPVNEFLDTTKKYIILLDDNVFACGDWESIFDELQSTGIPFQFKQGIDIRLLTERKAKKMKEVNYHREYIFAFDFLKDRELIENKLQLLRKHYEKQTKAYVLCGFEGIDEKDIADTFERIFILAKYNCLTYLTRFENYKNSKYLGMYNNISAWCNQPSFLKSMSFREFSIARGMNSKLLKKYKIDGFYNYEQYLKDGYKKGAAWRYMEEFEQEHPEIAKKYFDLKYKDINQYK